MFIVHVQEQKDYHTNQGPTRGEYNTQASYFIYNPTYLAKSQASHAVRMVNLTPFYHFVYHIHRIQQARAGIIT
jgi:hypothetical protein